MRVLLDTHAFLWWVVGARGHGCRIAPESS